MCPLIGIPCDYTLHNSSRCPVYGNNQAYVKAIEDAGGIPVLVSCKKDLQELDCILERLDGFLLPGGKDIQPCYYHEKPQAELTPADPELDALEFALIHYAFQQNMPILGICRGAQILNVYCGGTLCQDIKQEYPTSMQHLHSDKPRSELVHDISLDKQSRIAKLLGTTGFPVNSLHHQAIKQPGKGVQVVGCAKDNTIEAIEINDYRFAIGLQCHPEEIYNQIPACARLFQTFIDACVLEEAAPAEKEDELMVGHPLH